MKKINVNYFLYQIQVYSNHEPTNKHIEMMEFINLSVIFIIKVYLVS